MNILIIFVSAALTWSAIEAENENQNKTKRGVVDQTNYYGDPSIVKYFQAPDSASSAASHPNSPNYYSNNQRPVLFHNPNVPVKTGTENEPAKQVTVQQVLYEYQQTPHNAVSNVHVNQQFQTAPVPVPDAVHSQTTFPSQTHFVNQPHILQVEPNQFSGVAAPVQHGAVINHGQGYSKFLYPYPVVHTTLAPPLRQNNPQPKYIYANGKILYHPQHLPVNVHNSNPYPGITLPARPQTLLTHVDYRPAVVTQKPFRPSPPLIPFTYSRYQTHPKPPVKKTEAPVKEEAEEEENDDKGDVREEQDEEGETDDLSNYEEQEEDDFKPSAYYSKYKYDDDDEDRDNERYREQEDDEEQDNTRSYSRYVKKNPKKPIKSSESKPGSRYHKNDHYKFKEGYENNKKYSMEYKSPSNYYKSEPRNKKPQSQFKSYKYYKSSSNSKPKKEVIEGLQSRNIPIIHNKKLIRQEKWLITKKDNSE